MIDCEVYNALDNIKSIIRKKDNQIIDLHTTISEQEEEIKKLSNNIKADVKIDKESFIKAMNAIRSMEELLDNLYNLDIYISDNEVICNLISTCTDLLSICVNDPLNQPDIYSDLSYFIYDLDWGKNYKPGTVKEKGKDIDMSSIEKMWEYFNRKKEDDE